MEATTATEYNVTVTSYGHLEVLRLTQLRIDGEPYGEPSRHRQTIARGDWASVQALGGTAEAIATALWTPEALATWEATEPTPGLGAV